MKQFLFSYGTLQEERVQHDLFGRKLHANPDLLVGYAIKQIEITDPDFLAKGENPVQRTLVKTGNDNDRIAGAALELSEAELEQADRYEPVNYQRHRVVLHSGREAWVYLAN